MTFRKGVGGAGGVGAILVFAPIKMNVVICHLICLKLLARLLRLLACCYVLATYRKSIITAKSYCMNKINKMETFGGNNLVLRNVTNTLHCYAASQL